MERYLRAINELPSPRLMVEINAMVEGVIVQGVFAGER
jgi:hypothetical protein